MTLSVKDFYSNYGLSLGLELSSGEEETDRVIKVPHVQRPGLSLAGYRKGKRNHRILVFGRMELNYLRDLDKDLQEERLKNVVTEESPCVIVARGLTPPRELIKLCKELKVPIFKTEMRCMPLLTKLTMFLSDCFAPVESVHGTLVEAYGVGVLIQGDSSVGKSEAALGLIERGHRLISDDVVKLRTREGVGVIGFGPDLNKHLLELRGIGIVNVAYLFGAVSIRKEVPIDIVIHLEDWNESHYYDRIGLEERFTEFLGVRVPLYVHPVKPGRDVVLLIETTLLNHRLKEMGYHSAKEFNRKLLEEITRKKELGRES
ncbi:MAG: HPr(Ser) kinase/phosphatase [Chlamydiales bacterium]|nr:HPr(Ser) kinase/phosphatase [Chlamydiia bacterium]MCP5505130.1 HPr(Ser) kinase/phosphatase [Chlamydiales bacterium]